MSQTATLDAPTLERRITPTEDGIRDWLCQRIGAALRLQPSQMDADITFDRYGLDSVQAVEVTTALGEGLGLPDLSPTLLYDFPTINQLTTHVAGMTRVH
jgi:acyl carrier protein